MVALQETNYRHNLSSLAVLARPTSVSKSGLVGRRRYRRRDYTWVETRSGQPWLGLPTRVGAGRTAVVARLGSHIGTREEQVVRAEG